jgi:hypothetical protein
LARERRERLARRSRERVQPVRLAGGGLDVVEESAELGPAQLSAGVGHRLHEPLEVELGRQRALDAVQRLGFGARLPLAFEERE